MHMEKIHKYCHIYLDINNTSIKENKRVLLEKGIAKIKVIDFLLNLSYDKQIISNKKYLKLGDKLEDIIKYMTGWLKKLQEEN